MNAALLLLLMLPPDDLAGCHEYRTTAYEWKRPVVMEQAKHHAALTVRYNLSGRLDGDLQSVMIRLNPFEAMEYTPGGPWAPTRWLILGGVMASDNWTIFLSDPALTQTPRKSRLFQGK